MYAHNDFARSANILSLALRVPSALALLPFGRHYLAPSTIYATWPISCSLLSHCQAATRSAHSNCKETTTLSHTASLPHLGRIVSAHNDDKHESLLSLHPMPRLHIGATPMCCLLWPTSAPYGRPTHLSLSMLRPWCGRSLSIPTRQGHTGCLSVSDSILSSCCLSYRKSTSTITSS